MKGTSEGEQRQIEGILSADTKRCVWGGLRKHISTQKKENLVTHFEFLGELI